MSEPRGGGAYRMVEQLKQTASVHQSSLILLLDGLEEAQRLGGVDELPKHAEALRVAVWPFLQLYGRRDHRGAVDDSVDELPRPWRPGDDDEDLVE